MKDKGFLKQGRELKCWEEFPQKGRSKAGMWRYVWWL